MSKQLCVFCASSAKVHQDYFEATIRFANAAVDGGYSILYGGGALGLMGALADTAISKHGKVTGIIPDFMRSVEWDHKGISELIVVNDMRERKKLLIEHADAIVVLPGGSGTIEELFEAISLKKLGMITIPIVILNQNGFYDSLEQLMEKMISERFMRAEHRNIWTFVKTPEEIIPAVENAQPWSKDAIHFAAV